MIPQQNSSEQCVYRFVSKDRHERAARSGGQRQLQIQPDGRKLEYLADAERKGSAPEDAFTGDFCTRWPIGPANFAVGLQLRG